MMKQISPESIWHMDNDRLCKLLDKKVPFLKAKKILFYAPSFAYYKTSYYSSSPTDFPTISVTGKKCSLDCRHCGGHVLETMYPVSSSDELFDLCVKLKKQGSLGCLMSGGCLPDGSVPLEGFIDGITKVKQELGLTVLVHTGIVSESRAAALAEAKVDSALIDIVGSNDTIRKICKLNVTVEDYDRSLQALQKSHVPFVPHVIVGLDYGKLKGEFQALKIIRKYKPAALVIIAFMPIRRTEMEKVKPSTPLDITKVIAVARSMFAETPIALGCMRPRGKQRAQTDVLAIKAGVDAMAFPTEEAVSFARKVGMDAQFSSFCCSQMYVDIPARPISA